jgi:hypothetical protein
MLYTLLASADVIEFRTANTFSKPTIGNDSLHEISNYNGVRVVNFGKR